MENLGIDPKLLMAQLINFLLFFVIIKKFIVKPFTLFLDQEKKQEKEKEDTLAKIKKTEELLLKDQANAKAKARLELDSMLEQAKKDGLQIKQEMLVAAQKEVDEIKERMKKQLEEEKEGMYKEMKEQIAAVSINLVNEGIKDALDESDKSKITKRILSNLSKTELLQN